MHYVLIGSGVAGTTAAETLRRLDPQSRISMIGDESGPPYCRPMISLLLEGRVSERALAIKSADFYETRRIDPVFGTRVRGIDSHAKQVATQDGRELAYDRLLIASGADPRPVKAKNRELDNIFYMRTRSQVKDMLAALPKAGSALVLGGGLVGFKAAYGLLRRGLNVTMLIRSQHPLSMQVDAAAGRMIRDVLEEHGLCIRVGTDVAAFEGDTRVRGALLNDGSRLACDLVVIGKGVTPARDFVPAHQIAVDAGIRVDSRMQTTAPDVFAAGDVAETMDLVRRRPWVNALWPEAVSQGEAAARNMAGMPFSYRGSLSRNVIRVFDTDIMTAGLVNPPKDEPGIRVLAEEDPRRGTYRKLLFRGEALAGFVLVNRIEQGGILASLLRSETPITTDPRRLLRPDFNFAQLLPGSAGTQSPAGPGKRPGFF